MHVTVMPVSAYMALAFVFGFIPNKLMMMTLDIHNCMTNNINTTCGRLPEKANAKQAGHLVKNKIKLRKTV